MNALLADTLTAAGICASMAAGYYVYIGLNRLVLAAELAEGCTTCYLLGAIPFGPPYWALRTHLQKSAGQPDESIRLPAQ